MQNTRSKNQLTIPSLPQISGRDPPPGAGLPVHRQVRRGVPRQLAARRQDHQARHQGRAGVLRRRQLNYKMFRRSSATG